MGDDPATSGTYYLISGVGIFLLVGVAGWHAVWLLPGVYVVARVREPESRGELMPAAPFDSEALAELVRVCPKSGFLRTGTLP